MFNDANNVLALIGPDDRVLDVGGGVEVFPRADAVLDLMPYAARQRAQLAHHTERFGPDDWFVGDVCSAAAWAPFADKSFDFVICSHVLEDVRDPIYLCSQLMRVGKAGYIETPSRFRECAKASADDGVTGWEHHRWVMDVEGDTLVFTQKNPWVHRFDYLGDHRRHYLSQHAHQFTAVHWVGGFDVVERAQKGSPTETENLFLFYDQYDYATPPPLHRIAHAAPRGRTFEWLTDFQLPIERTCSPQEVLARHRARPGGPGGAAASPAPSLLSRLRRLAQG